jgi:single-strand DNA-binding protein
MQPLNNVVLLRGNLSNDPELRYTKKDVPVCNFNLATNEFQLTENGQRKKHTEWHKITAWGKCAEQCAKALEMGREITLRGKLVTKKWTDKDGQERQATEIHTTEVEFGCYPHRDDEDNNFSEDPADLTEDSL